MTRVAMLAAVAVLVTLAAPASAETITYNFDLHTPNGYPVTNIVMFAAGDGQDDVFVAPGTLLGTGIQSLTHTTSFDVTSALILGINPTDGTEKPHVVVFANNGFAAGAYGVKWSSVFDSSSPDYVRHSTVITLLEEAHAGDLSGISDFLRGPHAGSAAFDPGGPFSIVVFSVASNGGASIPEPAGLALLGVAAAAFARRRKKTA